MLLLLLLVLLVLLLVLQLIASDPDVELVRDSEEIVADAGASDGRRTIHSGDTAHHYIEQRERIQQMRAYVPRPMYQQSEHYHTSQMLQLTLLVVLQLTLLVVQVSQREDTFREGDAVLVTSLSPPLVVPLL